MIITGTTEGTDCNHQRHPGSPLFPQSDYQHIQDKELKEHKGKPIASFQGPQLMEKERRRCQKKQEDKRRQQLHHHLMPGNSLERPLRNRFKQPTADKEEARQTKKDKHGIIAHPIITQAEMTDMCEYHEDHCESPHGINISYSLAHTFAKVRLKQEKNKY